MAQENLDSKFEGLDLNNPFADAVASQGNQTHEDEQLIAFAVENAQTDSIEPILESKSLSELGRLETLKKESILSTRLAAASRVESENLKDLGPLGPLEASEPLKPKLALDSPLLQRNTENISENSLLGQNDKYSNNDQPDLPFVCKYEIDVGDPQKSGDLRSKYTVYKVTTKTLDGEEWVVFRRYTDFCNLYETLHESHPGVIVPPPPQKQAVGRFSEAFIELRRASLKVMLKKIALHQSLSKDENFLVFLNSYDLVTDMKLLQKEKIVPPEIRNASMFPNLGFTAAIKFQESDLWFEDKMTWIDSIDFQMKKFLKSVNRLAKTREYLAESTADFAKSLKALSLIELNRSLGESFALLSFLEEQIQAIYDRQNQQDTLTLGATADEACRLVASAKKAFTMREKAWILWQVADSDLEKRKSLIDKTFKHGKTQQDSIKRAKDDAEDIHRRCIAYKKKFQDVSSILRKELERFDVEKMELFKASIELALEGHIETQKELIEHWETFVIRLDSI